jgi:hypothetical protein
MRALVFETSRSVLIPAPAATLETRLAGCAPNTEIISIHLLAWGRGGKSDPTVFTRNCGGRGAPPACNMALAASHRVRNSPTVLRTQHYLSAAYILVLSY